MARINRLAVVLGFLASAWPGARAVAQDLYDTTVLRTFEFTFTQSNWETLLRSNYASQTNLAATLTIDGVSYPNVGVRIRGNTSFTTLPPGSQKFSLNVDIDFIDPLQRIMGYRALNLNNSFHDPTFCREVLYNNYVAQFMPNGRANHAVVTINGQNWGVYANVQQFDKVMLDGWFTNPDGLRVKCPNNPNGPGLRYNGATSTGYSTAYEIKDPGGFADPWPPHIAVCNALSNGAIATWPSSIDPIFAVDPSIWSVVFENILTDDDSYVNKGADFVTYRDPISGRTYLLQTDANETFIGTTWIPTRNFTNATTRPFLNRVLGVPELRQRFFAHYRTAKQDLSWAGYFEPRATALRNLIDAAVQADTKKIYTYAQFQTNFTSSVTLGCSGPCGGTVPGLQQFVNDRLTFLNSQAELVAQGPTIAAVSASDYSPDPASPVVITADVAPNGSPVDRVDLYYRPSEAGVYQKVQMNSTGGTTYTVVLPVAGAPGLRVPFYVGAVSSNAFLSQSYLPAHTEWSPLVIEYTFGSTGGMRITEYMYDGPGGSFVEFTNLSNAPIDLAGWSMDDDHEVPGTIPLAALGIVAPSASVIVAEADPSIFRANWNLSAGVGVIGGMGVTIGNNLARNDAINLYNASNVVQDRLTYGDVDIPGSVRANNVSAQVCRESIGQNDALAWTLSQPGDAFGSFAALAGELGTPGSHNPPSCNPCPADLDDGSGTGTPDGGVDISDLLYFLVRFDAGC